MRRNISDNFSIVGLRHISSVAVIGKAPFQLNSDVFARSIVRQFI